MYTNKDYFGFKKDEVKIDPHSKFTLVLPPGSECKEYQPEELNNIEEDVTAWDQGNMWPFTCYSPRNRNCLTCFKDISPEELRWGMIEAERYGTVLPYLNEINNFSITEENSKHRFGLNHFEKYHYENEKPSTTQHTIHIPFYMYTNKDYFGFKKDEVKIDPHSKFTLVLPPGSECKEYQPEELNNIEEDVTAWDQGNMWPFTCYSPRDRNCLTCFEDISPEESPWGMIEAERYGTVLPYIQTSLETLAHIHDRRKELQNPTSQLLKSLSPNESNVSSTNFQNTQNVLARTSFKLPEKNSGTFSSSTNGSSSKFSLSNLSRREPSQQIAPANNNQQNIFNSRRSSAKSFSFTLAAAETETEMNTFSTDVQSSEVTLLNNFDSKSEQAFAEKSTSSKDKYTELSQLSKMEKEQFMAPKFVSGMIPTKPPPIELCLLNNFNSKSEQAFAEKSTSSNDKYTELSQLSKMEKEQFMAPKFVSGMIPTKPPPIELCLLNNFNSKSEQAFAEKSTSSNDKYTELSQLSKMEKEQFMAPKFVSGMIPTKPPPIELCLLNNFNSKSEQAFAEKSTSSNDKYTELSQLSKMEKEQFMAPKFVSGMIPTKPPPIELCLLNNFNSKSEQAFAEKSTSSNDKYTELSQLSKMEKEQFMAPKFVSGMIPTKPPPIELCLLNNFNSKSEQAFAEKSTSSNDKYTELSQLSKMEKEQFMAPKFVSGMIPTKPPPIELCLLNNFNSKSEQAFAEKSTSSNDKYTELSQLSKMEKEQFMAPKFVSGMIPTKPPPIELCLLNNFNSKSEQAFAEKSTSSNDKYTELSQLSKMEKEQFMAPKFVSGMIPTKPPPIELCLLNNFNSKSEQAFAEKSTSSNDKYTELSQLSKMEKEQFMAPKFVSGMIPTKPPPIELCY
ncbi:uncharacterized protein LOC111626139 [Centruroides sculpturatus]|uniref:uncharacterized protein LOC111626139 n=1 Tax=Centruroides sculpturatus TaxID=218467 RepID=UPI000C6D1D5C|nr:uncharacterized protein LOC111626139 [Centruroides sculpturatus]